MRKIAIGTALIFIGIAANANALPYSFTDTIDYWNIDGTSYGEYQTSSHYWGSVRISEGDNLYYTHDINDDVNFLAGDIVTSANLSLDFVNDKYDFVVTGFWDQYISDPTEHIYYAFDGGAWSYLGEVDNGQYDIGLDVSLLNIDGQLSVALAVSNWDNGNTDAWLHKSVLSGIADDAPAPVPEPATMLLFGTGLAGIAGLRSRRKKK
jgi:hypothetical protein